MVSSFNEYQKEAMKTAVYPNIGSNLAYPVLGLIDEIGEYLVANFGDRYAEIADCAWYIAATATELCANMDDLANHTELSYEDSNGFCLDTLLSLSDLAGVAKKSQRDNGGKVQEHKIDLALYALSVVFYQWRQECEKHGWGYDRLLQDNLDKLADRQSRNVIKGDGDYR